MQGSIVSGIEVTAPRNLRELIDDVPMAVVDVETKRPIVRRGVEHFACAALRPEDTHRSDFERRRMDVEDARKPIVGG